MAKKIFTVSAVLALVLVFGAFNASADWEIQYPEPAMVFPYVKAGGGFQTFILVSHQDTPDWGGASPTNPNVVVKFNPKCGRGEARSFTLTTKQILAITPDVDVEGWAEAFVKEDITNTDWHPLSGISIILDVANGVTYGIKALHFYGWDAWNMMLDGASEPVVYGCNAAGACEGTLWGIDSDNPIVAELWRNPGYGKTMFALLDPNGRHILSPSADDTTLAYLSNKAQLDLYSKSETDAHKQVEWCTGADAGKPGVVTVGVGTTSGPLGTTDTSITTPVATITDAPYGFAQSYNLRDYLWMDINSDGNVDLGEALDETPLMGAVLNRLYTSGYTGATEAHQMLYKWATY